MEQTNNTTSIGPGVEIMKAAALHYRDLGMSVIIVGKNKKPLIPAWKEYQTRRATAEEINEWFAKFPDANIAIVTGAISGIVVVDVEQGGSTSGYPPTVTAKTGNDGRHLVYKHPGKPVANGVRIKELTDVRGDSGYILAAPSVTDYMDEKTGERKGGEYEWLVSPDDAPFSDLPLWILEDSKQQDSPKKTDWNSLLKSEVLEGSRNATAVQVAGKILYHLPVEMWDLVGWTAVREWNNAHNKPPLPELELMGSWSNLKKKELKRRKNNMPAPKVDLPKRVRIHQFEKPETETNFDDWKKVIVENFPDLLFPSEVANSVLCQIPIKDITNPSAVALIDVPSSGKTICINYYSDIPELTYPTDKFTPASFVSNAANVKKAKLAEIDLLPRVQYKMLMIRDLATLFSKRDDDLTEALGILTRLLDGEGLNTDSGIHGQREYSGEYLFMILAASTPIPPKVWKIMGNLGSRLFFLNMHSRDKGTDELVSQLKTSAYKKKEKICRSATRNFMQTIWYRHRDGIEWNKDGDSDEDLKVISNCAQMLAKLRGVVNVWTDGFDYSYSTPVVEKPDRINQLFYNLVRGHAVSCGRTQINRDDLKIIVQLTMDSMPSSRAFLLSRIINHGGTMKTSEIEKELNCSKPTALKEMEILWILGVCSMDKDSGGLAGGQEKEIHLSDEFKWLLSEECRSIRGLPPVEIKLETETDTVVVETSPIQSELIK